ncbi:MAG: hypothetical protein B7Z75_00360 [Acidocella sp. 20-57-95]|nr:MAG: hypothetical protein B7Z75_00360 [Acidocella sp. 20-57-95]HQT63312.1 hypothetical protein [Acidocella sp.]HQU03846.1 hypothetical protein [Acidocella sp.]
MADMRIQIVIGGVPAPDDAVLMEVGQTPPAQGYVVSFSAAKPGHIAGCTCCAPRGPVAAALTAMFRARVTGAAPFFQRVVLLASKAGEAAVQETLATDTLCGARYRLG